MKIFINRLTLIAAALFLAAASAPAAIFTNLYIFTADAFPNGPDPEATNSDGANPDGFVLSGNTLYGTAAFGGPDGYGTIFRVNTDGTHFTNLLSFTNGAYDSTNGTYPHSIGDMPNPGLLLVSNTLYGTTFYGGTNFAGTVFKIDTDGSNFAKIHDFNFTDGNSPASGLTLYNNALYGTTVGGGSNNDGTVFAIDLSGLGFTSLYNFTTQINPYGGVVVSDNIIYGFGEYGGGSSNGVFYSVDGGTYTDLFDFSGTNGWAPYSTPTLVGDTLFGVTYQGGTNGGGNVFRIDTEGLQYTNLYNFTREGGANTEGANPYDYSGLVLSGNKIYGTTSVGGSGGQGTVFQLNTDGSGFTVLHSFDYADGGNPQPLILSGGTLYGMTYSGIRGIASGDGAVFALFLAPALDIQLITNAVVVSWNDPSASLYAAPAINGVFTNIPGATSPYTSSITASQQFFELQ